MKFSSIVPSQDLEYEPGLGAVNLEVAVPAVSDSKSEKRKTYQKWSSQERFTIGKYAAINDPTAAKKNLDQRADQGFVSCTKQS